MNDFWEIISDMHIAEFINQFPVFSQTFISNQFVGIHSRGVKMDIYNLRTTADKPAGEYELDEDLQRSIHPSVSQHSTRLLRLSQRLRLIPKLGLKRPIATANCLNPLKYGRAAASFSMLFDAAAPLQAKSADYDIVHAHFGPIGIRTARLHTAGVVRGPLICSFYGNDTSQLPREHGEDIYQELFERATLILSLSQFMSKRLLELGCPKNKLVIHHLGIDPEMFTFHPRIRDPSTPTRLLFVGRFVEKKGIFDALQALSQVLAHGYQVELTLIGDGDLRDSVEQLVDEHDLRRHIRMLGRQSQPVVAQEMARAHVMVVPSRTSPAGDQEGTPTVIAEAMANGLPLLTTRHSGIPEMVKDGVDGYLAPEGDPEALAHRLMALIDASDRWPEMGQAGRKRVECEFNIHKLNDRLIELYTEVAASQIS